MLVQELLERTAARMPDTVALVCGSSRLTYGAIDAAANRLAHGLGQLGVRRGDRVVLWLPNAAECVVSLFAVLKADAAFVVLNPSTPPEKVAALVNHCGASALIAEGDGGRLSAIVERCQTLRGVVTVGGAAREVSTAFEPAGHARMVRYADIQAHAPADRRPVSNVDLDLACIVYTSGSTGESKGVMADHDNVVFAATSVNAYLEHAEDDVVMNVLPLSFGYGLYQVFMTFQVGARLVLERSLAFPAAVLGRMQGEGVTGFAGVPTIFAVLRQLDLSSYDLSRLRYLTNAAAALPPAHITELQRLFPTVRLFSMYGLTETKRALYLEPAELARRPLSVGKAIPGTEVWLVDERGQRIGPGQVGELVVRGRHVMRGYWAAPEESARRFRPGPLPGERVCHTGDLFTMDDEGFFYFVGRQDDVIKSRGEKIAPAAIERVLYSLPGIVEVAVVGVPDALLGEAVKAFVVPNGVPLTEQAVLAFCRERLEPHMVPKYVEFRTSLPRTATGKISKIELGGLRYEERAQ